MHLKWIYLPIVTIALSACSPKTPSVTYLNFQDLEGYPSGSAISVLNGKFYIMGDDASDILVLDSALKEYDRIPVFPKGETQRIEKAVKADIESSLVVTESGNHQVLFWGSGSVSPQRDSAYLLNTVNKAIRRINLNSFYSGLRKEFQDLNIEAATLVSQEILLGVRGNNSQPDNYIVIASSGIDAIKYKREIKINTRVEDIGISGMDYSTEQDILFITFSSEDTSNSFDDGKIGDSYLAIIMNASGQLQQDELSLDSLTKLADLSPVLKRQKIESVTFDKKGRLLLVADDDQGHTRLFSLAFN